MSKVLKKPQTTIVKVEEVKLNEDNPRYIREDSFNKLVNSIKQFPQMLDIRPIVVNKDMIILGGNMRYKACVEAGMKEIPVVIADNLTTKEQEAEFLVKDNVSGGEWDWDVLANNYDNELLIDWGVDIWQGTDENIELDDFFEDNTSEPKEGKNQIVLEYTQEDYDRVIEAFNNLDGTKEEIIFNFLTGE